MAALPGTLLLYEAPHRLEATLGDIRCVLGERQIVVARELTKIFEEFIRGTVSDVMAVVAQGRVKGEVVILVAPGEAMRQAAAPLEEIVRQLLDVEGLSVKDAARKAAGIAGVSRNEAYAEALRLRSGADTR